MLSLQKRKVLWYFCHKNLQWKQKNGWSFTTWSLSNYKTDHWLWNQSKSRTDRIFLGSRLIKGRSKIPYIVLLCLGHVLIFFYLRCKLLNIKQYLELKKRITMSTDIRQYFGVQKVNNKEDLVKRVRTCNCNCNSNLLNEIEKTKEDTMLCNLLLSLYFLVICLSK